MASTTSPPTTLHCEQSAGQAVAQPPTRPKANHHDHMASIPASLLTSMATATASQQRTGAKGIKRNQRAIQKVGYPFHCHRHRRRQRLRRAAPAALAIPYAQDIYNLLRIT